MKKYWVVLSIFVAICIEFVSFSGLVLIGKIYYKKYRPTLTRSLSSKHQQLVRDLLKNEPTYGQYSSDLGWTIRKNGSSALFKANSQGLRGDREYRLAPKDSMIRVATFGDSFTHGDEVANPDTWQEQLGQLAPTLELLNFGVNGYGLDQAFLRYERDGVKFRANIVLIGFLSENILRNINTFRPFYSPNTKGPMTKPYFTLKDNELVRHINPFQQLSDYQQLLESPEDILPKLGANDYYFNNRYKKGSFDFLSTMRFIKMTTYELLYRERLLKYQEGSYPLKLTKKIFDLFYETVQKNDSIPIIIVFPGKRDIYKYYRNGVKKYQSLLKYFESKNYRYIDMYDAFDPGSIKSAIKDLFKVSHYSPLGNNILARHILKYFCAENLIPIESRNECNKI